MAKLKVHSYQVGPVCTNCYFAANTETKEAIIIDPGAAADYRIETDEKEGLRPVAVLHAPWSFRSCDSGSGCGITFWCAGSIAPVSWKKRRWRIRR